MRAYFFVNSALSGIQKGLQMGHVVAEMANKARDIHPAKVFYNWSEAHKTVVLLEGGFHANLKEIEAFFTPVTYEGEWPEGFEPPEQNPYLWASFTEDEETMNAMMTCVGIILPERIYEAARVVRKYKLKWVNAHDKLPCDEFKFNWEAILRHDEPDRPNGWSETFTKWEVELIKLMNSCPLAR